MKYGRYTDVTRKLSLFSCTSREKVNSKESIRLVQNVMFNHWRYTFSKEKQIHGQKMTTKTVLRFRHAAGRNVPYRRVLSCYYGFGTALSVK